MRRIERWFEAARRRQRRTEGLYASLLSDSLPRYFAYRLRYAFLLQGSGFVFHVLEFTIILAAVGELAAFVVIALRSGTILVRGAWWGALEPMRERLRAMAAEGAREASEREIGHWLLLSFVAAALLVLLGAGLLQLSLPGPEDDLAQVYGFLIVVELAARLPVLVLHSGMYATRRVYRPLWSMFLPTGVQLAVLGAGAAFFPAAALVIAILASTAASCALTLHFTWRMYRLTGLAPRPGLEARALVPFLAGLPGARMATAAVAGVALRADSVLVLAILGIYGTGGRALDLAAAHPDWRAVDAFTFFYLILPAFRGAYEWASLFYFDFVRLRRQAALAPFRRAFFRKLLLATPLVTGFFWAMAAALGLLLFPEIPPLLLLALLPLFVVRGFVGLYQVRTFADGHFLTLIGSIGLFAGLLVLVWLDVNAASDLLEVLAALLLVLLVLVNLQHLRDRRAPPPDTLLSLGDFVGRLGSEPGPVAVGEIRLSRRVPHKQRRLAADLVREAVAGRGHLAFRSPRTLLYYVTSPPAGDDDPAHPRAVAAGTGGAASGGRLLGGAPGSGRTALARLVEEGWIAAHPERQGAPEALLAAFRVLFPDGIAIDTETLEGAREARRLDDTVAGGALSAAARSLAAGETVVAASGRLLSAVFVDGAMRLLFVLPAGTDEALAATWRRMVADWYVARGTAAARLPAGAGAEAGDG